VRANKTVVLPVFFAHGKLTIKADRIGCVSFSHTSKGMKPKQNTHQSGKSPPLCFSLKSSCEPITEPITQTSAASAEIVPITDHLQFTVIFSGIYGAIEIEQPFNFLKEIVQICAPDAISSQSTPYWPSQVCQCMY
jgi:hypothetical protein